MINGRRLKDIVLLNAILWYYDISYNIVITQRSTNDDWHCIIILLRYIYIILTIVRVKLCRNNSCFNFGSLDQSYCLRRLTVSSNPTGRMLKRILNFNLYYYYCYYYTHNARVHRDNKLHIRECVVTRWWWFFRQSFTHQKHIFKYSMYIHVYIFVCVI